MTDCPSHLPLFIKSSGMKIYLAIKGMNRYVSKLKKGTEMKHDSLSKMPNDVEVCLFIM